MWTVDVDVIRSAGRERYRESGFYSLSRAWLYIRRMALPGDQFVIGKARA